MKSQSELALVDPSCTLTRDFLQFFPLRTRPPDIPREGSVPPLLSLLECHLSGLLFLQIAALSLNIALFSS